MQKTIEVREYDTLTSDMLGELALEEISKNYSYVSDEDENGNTRTLLRHTKQGIIVQNFVGLLPIKDATIEIYPKIPLINTDEEKISDAERQRFYEMLRHYRKFKFARVGESDIDKLKNFSLYEVFLYLFLQQTLELVKRGIASRYETTEDNLPYLKGRLLFPQQAVLNSVNKARFYVQHDEYTPNHAANRLIRTALHKMQSANADNMRKRRQLIACFDDISTTTNLRKDWQTYQQHQQARTMQHYKAVMQWVQMLLFNDGITTYQGATNAPALLFPMEQVFEDFVSHHFKQHANNYTVQTQKPRRYMTADNQFQMQPDITLSENNNVMFILDVKWKKVDSNIKKYGISQGDMYQLFSYGKLYDCNRIALIYPKNKDFETSFDLTFKDDKNMKLSCVPFDIEDPENSVKEIIETLNPSTKQSPA